MHVETTLSLRQTLKPGLLPSHIDLLGQSEDWEPGFLKDPEETLRSSRHWGYLTVWLWSSRRHGVHTEHDLLSEWQNLGNLELMGVQF